MNASKLTHDRTKSMFTTLHNAGSVGKSTALISLMEYFKSKGIAAKTSTGDINHQDLTSKYGGESYDIRVDKDKFLNSVDTKTTKIIVDTPSAFVDTFIELFGDVNILLEGFGMYDTMPYFLIPVATHDKCFQNLTKIESLFNEVTADYRLIFVLNEGLMNKSEKDSIKNDFFNHSFVKDSLSSGKGTIFTITTVFTPEMAETLKKEDVAKVIAKDSKTNPHTKVLMFSFLNNSNKQWETILGTTE